MQDIAGRKQRSKMQYNKNGSMSQGVLTGREFSPRERVFVKSNPKNKHKPWIYRKVVGNPAPRACLVSTPLVPIRRNHTQIRKSPHGAYASLSNGAGLETASLLGGRPHAGGPKPTVDPTFYILSDQFNEQLHGPNISPLFFISLSLFL